MVGKCALFSFLMASFSLSAADSQLTITPLSGGVYEHISYQQVGKWGNVAARGLVVVDDKDAYIIDTPWSNDDTLKLVEWVKDQGFTLKAAVVTHFHQDASGGLDALNKRNIPTYAYQETNRLLKQHKGLSAKYTIEETPFSLLKDKIDVFYPGGGHTADNIVVWIEQHQILFAGCFVKGLNSKHLGNLEDAVVAKWPTSIENTLKTYPTIKQVFPGHGRSGDKSLLLHTAKLAENYLAEQKNNPSSGSILKAH